MKNFLFATFAAMVLSSSVGCCCGSSMFQPWGCSNGCGGCNSCGGGCGSGGGWGSWGGWGGGGCSSCGSGGCSSCGSGGCSSGGSGGCSSCGCSASNDCGYSSRFGYSGGCSAAQGAARYSNGAPPNGGGGFGAPWLSNAGCSNCNHCNHQPHGPGFGLAAPCCRKQGPQGPPMTAMQYPYYANRGPRDFLAKNPPSIGP